ALAELLLRVLALLLAAARLAVALRLTRELLELVELLAGLLLALVLATELLELLLLALERPLLLLGILGRVLLLPTKVALGLLHRLLGPGVLVGAALQRALHLLERLVELLLEIAALGLGLVHQLLQLFLDLLGVGLGQRLCDLLHDLVLAQIFGQLAHGLGYQPRILLELLLHRGLGLVELLVELVELAQRLGPIDLAGLEILEHPEQLVGDACDLLLLAVLVLAKLLAQGLGAGHVDAALGLLGLELGHLR